MYEGGRTLDAMKSFVESKGENQQADEEEEEEEEDEAEGAEGEDEAVKDEL